MLRPSNNHLTSYSNEFTESQRMLLLPKAWYLHLPRQPSAFGDTGAHHKSYTRFVRRLSIFRHPRPPFRSKASHSADPHLDPRKLTMDWI